MAFLIIVGLGLLLGLAMIFLPKPPGMDQEVAAIHYQIVAEEAVKAQLRDPDSARFQDEKALIFHGEPVVCGYVNANNGFGGKSGFQQFIWKNSNVEFEGAGGTEPWTKLWILLCSSTRAATDEEAAHLPAQ